MAVAKSGLVQIVGWGGHRGGNSRYQASTTTKYYYKQKGTHWGGVPTGGVNKGSKQVLSKYYYKQKKGRLSTVHGSFG